MIELSEEEVRVLRGSKALMDQLLKSPKTKRTVEKAVKDLYPETVTTDDVAAPYIERLEATEKKLDTYLKEQKESALENKFQGQVQALRDEGYTEEGIEKIKEIMVKESIPNAIAASKLFDKANPPKPQEPSGFQSTNWGIGGTTTDENLNLLFKDEDAWAEQEARRVWAEEAKKNQIAT